MHVPAELTAPGATHSDWYLDVALAGMGLVLLHLPFVLIMAIFPWPYPSAPFFVNLVTGALVFASAAINRHYPPIFAILVFLLCLAQLIFLQYPTVSWIVFLMTVYTMGRWMSQFQARITLWCSVAMAVIAPFRWVYQAGQYMSNMPTLLMLSVVASIGAVLTSYSIGRRGHDTAKARARQERAEKEASESLTAESVAQQKSTAAAIRTALARELHDIVAHSIAIMIVQAEGGLSQMDKNPNRSREALDTIASTGRVALSDMRLIVRTLRSDTGEQLPLGNPPTLADLPELVRNSSAWLVVHGQPRLTPPALQTTVYRVVQEGLTNVLKHAGIESEPQVTLAWDPTRLTVTITNKGTDRPLLSDNKGTGLIGMTERVHTHSGTLTYGPNASGGFELCAQFPL